MTEITAINRTEMLALDDDNQSHPIESFLDIDGDECDSEGAVVAIVALNDGSWASVDLSAFDPVYSC